ncbi:MAG: ThiF family adenylyltransferase [Chloroflexi bacterium]|nr:ThiF family adenylyltransferase [Chloroflexota bacterium]MDA1147175.1 ThiF family adenylyltransferase [Chloroflexota bacterium]
MAAVETLDQASLERFHTELIAHGYEPSDDDLRDWRGPAPASFGALTGAGEMRLMFRDGWPYRWPACYVEGLDLEHVTGTGDVCLWIPGDESMEWVTFEGVLNRIEEWCTDAQRGFPDQPRPLDAHLYFRSKKGLGLVDLDGLVGPAPDDGAIFPMRGQPRHGGRVVRLSRLPDHLLALLQQSDTDIGGRAYTRDDILHPPRSFDEFRAALTAEQLRDLDLRVLGPIESGERELALALLVWRIHGARNALLLVFRRVSTGTDLFAIELAESDVKTLTLRSGPAQAVLRDKRVCLFGVGAIGSTLAVALSASGLGSLRLVDGDILRPGNVVRHTGSRSDVGRAKVDVVRLALSQDAVWTGVDAVREEANDPGRIAELINDADVAIDATGAALFTDLVSRVASLNATSLVSAALYRGGRISRVRRQREGVMPIFHRWNKPGAFPTIPIGDDDLIGFELGCSAPTANASPVSVLSVASLAARVVIDLLSGALELPDEIVDVLETVEAPFDSRGWVSFEVESSDD